MPLAVSLLALATLTLTPAREAGLQDAQPPQDPPAQAAPAAPAEPAESAPPAGTMLATLSPAALAAINAPFNTPDEARALRLKHGVSTPADFQTPAIHAAIMLTRGLWAHPALANPAADPLDRAEATLRRGDPAAALTLLADATSPRAIVLRAEALAWQGQTQRVTETLRPLVTDLAQGNLADSGAIVHAVAGAALFIRLNGPMMDNGTDFQALMGHLAKARTLDPLDHRVPLLEAQLLADKDNFAQARQAVNNALTLNPSAAEAWLLGGELAVLSFDFDTAERMAARLDDLAIIAEPDVALAEDRPETAPLAAAIRARALLRQNDPSSARLLMAPHAEAMPDSPLIGETGAMITAASYDLPALTSALDAFERRFPGPMGATAALRAGQTLSDLRQYAPATDTLTRAATLAPSWAAPATELGLLEMQRGRDDQAILALRTGTRLDPFNVRAANSLKLLDKLATFTRVESDHFIVRAAPGLDSRLAREMLPVLERIHTVVTANTGPGLAHSPAQKTIIDLSPDHASFAVRIAGISRIHTIAASTGPVIAMEAPRSGRGHTGAYDWARVLQHEYVHTVGLDKTGNRLPHWFTEAQAVYLEQAPRDWSTIKLLHQTVDSDDLFDLDAINIAFTRPKRPQDRALAYAQGHWMYEYLVITHGTDAPLTLMRLYAQGVREEEAFSRVLNQSRAAFLEAFKPWARAQLQSWGMFSAEADALEVQIRTALESAKGIVDDSIAAQLTQYATLRPVDPLSHRLLAQYWLTREPDKAIEHLRWLDVRSDKESTYAAQIAAIALRATPPRLDEAWPSAQRAVQIDPYNPAHRELAALVALQRTDYSAAEAHLQFLAELEPTRDQHTRRLEALQRLRRQ